MCESSWWHTCAEGRRVAVVSSSHYSLLELHFQFPWPGILIQLRYILKMRIFLQRSNPSFLRKTTLLGVRQRFKLNRTDWLYRECLADRAALHWMITVQHAIEWELPSYIMYLEILGAFQTNSFHTSLIPSCTCLVSLVDRRTLSMAHTLFVVSQKPINSNAPHTMDSLSPINNSCRTDYSQ